MSSFDPLGLRPDDPLERWRDDAEKRAQRKQQREKEQSTVVELRRELEAVRSEVYALHETLLEATGEAMAHIRTRPSIMSRN